MTDLLVLGLGAVSPAGWGTAPLHAALGSAAPLPAAPLPRPGSAPALQARRVPPPPSRPAFQAHPRLRRASPISTFATAAAFEALGLAPLGAPPAAAEDDRLGLVFCTMTGSVVYSRRFFEEVLVQPGTASPLLFPETVFNAPASHVAALLGLSGRVHTEVGDATCLAGALATAHLWLATRAVDRCLVVAAEEADWLSADGLALHQPQAVGAEGGGALLLARPEESVLPARGRLLVPPAEEFRNAPVLDTDHMVHAGEVRSVLGEAWTATSMWQCIEALHRLASHPFTAVELQAGPRRVRLRFAASSPPS